MAGQSPSPSPPQDFHWQELVERSFPPFPSPDTTDEADRPALPPDEFLREHLVEMHAAAGEEGLQQDHPASPRPDHPASPDHPYEPEEGYVRRPLRDWERDLEFNSEDEDDDDYDEFLTNSSDSEPGCARARPEQWAHRPNINPPLPPISPPLTAPLPSIPQMPPPLIPISSLCARQSTPELFTVEVETQPAPELFFAHPSTSTKVGPTWQPTTARMTNTVILNSQQVKIKQQAEEISQARQELEELQRAITQEKKKKQRAIEQRRCAAGFITCYDEWRRRCLLTIAKKKKEQTAAKELRDAVLSFYESLRRDAD